MQSVIKLRIFVLVLLLAGVLAGYFATPASIAFLPDVPYRLGLDLQGGTHLVYEADVSSISAREVDDAMQGLQDVIERRVNAFGVAEPVVQTEEAGDDRRLIVELAGVHDINEAIRLIGETPFLEFRTERPEAEREEILAAQEQRERLGEDPYFIPTELTGKYLQRADVAFGQSGIQPVVNLTFNKEGSALFEELTGAHIGEQVAIYLDGFPISAPVVQQEITGGQAQISGNFTIEEARELVRRLNAGALPLPITLISQQSVGASLGAEALEKGVTAGVYGLIAVMLFMILWYRVPGLLAVVALLMYTVIVLSLFKLLGVTLTAAGIAGFILSLGVAVDANILIFERFYEELRSGRRFETALQEGFGRARSAIIDSNVSSLITASILYWFGTSLIRGFALTLGIGIAMSMISSLIITRTFLRAAARNRSRTVDVLYGIPRV